MVSGKSFDPRARTTKGAEAENRGRSRTGTRPEAQVPLVLRQNFFHPPIDGPAKTVIPYPLGVEERPTMAHSTIDGTIPTLSQKPPQKQQQDIWDAIWHGETHVIVDARAGTGKTYTAVHSLKGVRKGLRTLLVSFNVAIVEEGRARVREHSLYDVAVSTYNSLGWRTVRKAYPLISFDPEKARKHTQGVKWSDYPFGLIPTVNALLGHARNLNLDVWGPDWEAQIEPLCDRFSLACVPAHVPMIAEITRKVLTGMLADKVRCDYGDQLYLPIRDPKVTAHLPEYDLILVDEAQDTNAIQQAMIFRMLAPGGRVVVFGDRYQSINGFRGADVDAFATFGLALGASDRGTVTLPLTTSRRCPQSHVRAAQVLVSDFRAMPDAPEGAIVEADRDTWVDRAEPGDLVLCRVNAPLVSACMRLWGQGVKARVVGQDLSKGLYALVKRYLERERHLADVLAAVEADVVRDCGKEMAKENPNYGRTQSLQDRLSCLRAVAEGCQDKAEFESRLARLFMSEEEAETGGAGEVRLGTVHKTKGLEADRVFVLCPELLPHPMAKTPEDMQQERNLAYVALTRAKRELVWAGKAPQWLRGGEFKPGNTRGER